SITHPATGNTIFTAHISLVEIYSALSRRLREKSISSVRYSRLSSVVNHTWSLQYVVIALTTPVLDTAKQLVERHPLRAYDAVQLAAAIHARRTLPAQTSSITFLSADGRLLATAQAEGFATDDPNLH
ncbi:MAG: type II toxin-antitoxin system VapC family toxin, partial [Blastocatellia bacterium]